MQIESQLAGNVRLTIITMCGDFGCYGYFKLRRSFPSDIQHYQNRFLKFSIILIRLEKESTKLLMQYLPTVLNPGALMPVPRKMAEGLNLGFENVRKEQEVQHMTELQLDPGTGKSAFSV